MPLFAGSLFKLGEGNMKWKSKYCCVEDGMMFYFDKEPKDKSKDSASTVFMAANGKVTKEEDAKYPFCFEIKTKLRVYKFATNNEESREAWIAALVYEGAVQTESAPVYKHGLVWKHENNKWAQKYVAIEGECLKQWDKKTAPKDLRRDPPRFVVELSTPVQLQAKDTYANTVDIHTAARVFSLAFDTADDGLEWQQAIQLACDRRNQNMEKDGESAPGSPSSPGSPSISGGGGGGGKKKKKGPVSGAFLYSYEKNKWQPRWMVIQGGSVLTKQIDEKSPPIEMESLVLGVSVTNPPARIYEHEYSFEIQFTGKKWVLSCHSEEEAQQWVDAIDNAVANSSH